jgi:hypothetical protein
MGILGPMATLLRHDEVPYVTVLISRRSSIPVIFYYAKFPMEYSLTF